MDVKKLFEGITVKSDIEQDCEIGGVKIDADQVRPGDLYICLKGTKFDGCDFAQKAIQNGAVYIVANRDLGIKNQIIVEDERAAFALICKNFYQKACEKLKIIGITGTNGKTSVCHITAQIFKKLGKKVGVIGTLGAFYDDKCVDVGLTTPDPNVLHKIFFDMAESGVEYVFMEVSAHALALKKLEGIKFQTAVLTNITQDHLDFFKTMDNYAKCKLSFIDKKYCRYALVCSDDEYACKLIDNPAVQVPVLSFGFANPSDCFAVYPQMSIDGSSFYANCLDQIAIIRTALVGKFNITNLLASIGICALEKIPLEEVAKVSKEIKPIEGRFNVIKGKNFNVVIDYAHTPDGLENLLKTVRAVSHGKIITVFGCGGNRDKGKRKIMGDIASRYSNFVIVTSDNPRFEEPLQIIQDIEKGMKGNYQVCPDRAQAISLGIDCCKKGDTLVIAGKGAESYQEIKGQKIPFSDYTQVYNQFVLRNFKIGVEND